MRIIRNYDVASYYPNIMLKCGYVSRNIPSPKIFEDVVNKRLEAKKSGDKTTANTLKLVVNTTYGAMLNKYNDLYDPLMGRSVCITGQLFLLELANHLLTECETLRVLQLNTDGIMVSFDDSEYPKVLDITEEWQVRTGFELEEDKIGRLVQKDVNNYIEVQPNGAVKAKGGYLVRGIAPAGAFNVNNNGVIVATALREYFVNNIPVEDTIQSCQNLLDFQLIAKASGLYSKVYHVVNGEKVYVQKCNRVYATKDSKYGTLFKTHKESGSDAKIAGLPEHCIIDNSNELTIDVVDKEWYIKLAKRQVNDFLGVKPPKKNTRKINSIKRQILKLLEGTG
jgi:hypothetical protein